MQRLEYRDLVAALREVAGTGQTGRTGTDDGDFLGIGSDGRWLHRLVLRHERICRKALETADGDCLALLGQYAVFLALILLRADTAADCRQGVRLLDFRYRAIEIALFYLCDERRYIYGYGAALAALRHLAVQAALRLSYGRLLIISQCHFIEIMDAVSRSLHRHLMLLHRYRHDNLLLSAALSCRRDPWPRLPRRGTCGRGS